MGREIFPLPSWLILRDGGTQEILLMPESVPEISVLFHLHYLLLFSTWKPLFHIQFWHEPWGQEHNRLMGLHAVIRIIPPLPTTRTTTTKKLLSQEPLHPSWKSMFDSLCHWLGGIYDFHPDVILTCSPLPLLPLLHFPAHLNPCCLIIKHFVVFIVVSLCSSSLHHFKSKAS